jgi:hypothetical protein
LRCDAQTGKASAENEVLDALIYLVDSFQGGSTEGVTEREKK